MLTKGINMRIYCLISGIIFALVALAQLYRAVEALNVTAAGTAIPIWASWVAVAVTGVLGIIGLAFAAAGNRAA